MKKMILLMLSLLLLLCACRKESDDSLQLTGNPESDPAQWNWFYWLSQCNSSEEISNSAIEIAKEREHVEKGDIAVLTAGIPSPHVGGFDYGVSNMMRIVTIE